MGAWAEMAPVLTQLPSGAHLLFSVRLQDTPLPVILFDQRDLQTTGTEGLLGGISAVQHNLHSLPGSTGKGGRALGPDPCACVQRAELCLGRSPPTGGAASFFSEELPRPPNTGEGHRRRSQLTTHKAAGLAR